jgi:hypothetical protein
MYQIIGVDGKEYGPVSAGQLTQWLVENRVNGQTLARVEGGNWKPLREYTEFASLPTAGPPPTMPGGVLPLPGSAADAVSTIIPYKNAAALTAYYLAVFSVIPCVGAPLGIAALVLGLRGLRFAKQHPAAKGTVHAWIGVVVGGIFGLGYTILIVWVLVAAASRR